MNTKVPLWGVVLTGFTMLFAVAFHRLGLEEAMIFCDFVAGAFLWALFTVLAYLACIVALAYGLGTFLCGLKKVPGTKYQWYFVNCIIVSFVAIVVGAFFAESASLIRNNATFLLDMVEDRSVLNVSFWGMYLTTLLISICLRYIKMKWYGGW